MTPSVFGAAGRPGGRSPTQERGRRRAPPRGPGPRSGAPEPAEAEHREETQPIRSAARHGRFDAPRTQGPRRCRRAPGTGGPEGFSSRVAPPREEVQHIRDTNAQAADTGSSAANVRVCRDPLDPAHDDSSRSSVPSIIPRRGARHTRKTCAARPTAEGVPTSKVLPRGQSPHAGSQLDSRRCRIRTHPPASGTSICRFLP